MVRIFLKISKKVILTTLLVGCLLGLILYVADLKVTSPRSADMEISENTQLLDSILQLTPTSSSDVSFKEETSDKTVKETAFLNKTTWGFLQKQQGADTAAERHPRTHISKHVITSVQIPDANNSSTAFTLEVFSKTTTMTFNKTLVIHCKESPYIECSTPDLEPMTGEIFKIAYVGRPSWVNNINVKKCSINTCVFDETRVTNDTDIVVIYGVFLNDTVQLQQRWPRQIYVMQVWESPIYIRSEYITNGQSAWNNQINMIMSYRLDADIFLPYDRLKFDPKPLHQRPSYYDIAKTKTRTAVWMVSHCKTPSLREKYVKEMQKYIDVDILGKCGQPCAENDPNCYNWTMKYKFYLSFENTLCKDYITEKFFKIFDRSIHVIPVVRGGADYDKHFPNFTYINSAHFKTPKDLALHLKHLAFDLETYSKYLEYKDMYTRILYNEGHRVPCQICTYLHTQTLPHPTQVYNLKERLADGQCHSPTDF